MQPNKPKPRRHIPALSPEQLIVALDKLKAARNVSPGAKKHLEQMMRAASNPNSEGTEVVIKTLPKERQTQIHAIAVSLTRHTDKAVQRGSAGLDAISQEEWDTLVQNAQKPRLLNG